MINHKPLIEKRIVKDPEIIDLKAIGVKLMPALRSDFSIPQNHERGYPWGFVETGPSSRMHLYLLNLDGLGKIIQKWILKMEAHEDLDLSKWSDSMKRDWLCVLEHHSIAERAQRRENAWDTPLTIRRVTSSDADVVKFTHHTANHKVFDLSTMTFTSTTDSTVPIALPEPCGTMFRRGEVDQVNDIVQRIMASSK